jgi:hypothetical protein
MLCIETGVADEWRALTYPHGRISKNHRLRPRDDIAKLQGTAPRTTVHLGNREVRDQINTLRHNASMHRAKGPPADPL